MPLWGGLGLGMGGARGFSNSFTPLQRSPLLWVINTKGVTHTTTVSAWADQSGNGNNLSSGNNPYTASDSSLGGQASIGITANGLVNGSLTVSQPCTVYVAGYLGNTSNDLFGSNTGRSSIGGLGTEWYIDAGTVLGAGTPNTTAHAFCAVFNGNSSVMYVDSSSSPVASGAAGSNSIAGPFVGGPFATSAGAVAEIVIVSGADSVAQVHQMFLYFTSRGLGISAS